MLLGVIANSVGRVEVVTSAVSLLLDRGAQSVLHCGDVGGRHVLGALASCDGAFVWGDRDRDRMGLMRYAHSIGVRCFGILGEFEFQSKRLLITHGDERKVLRKLLEEQSYDYILCGHELNPEDYSSGKTRVLNPGPLHGSKSPSALLLNPIEGSIEILTL